MEIIDFPFPSRLSVVLIIVITPLLLLFLLFLLVPKPALSSGLEETYLCLGLHRHPTLVMRIELWSVYVCVCVCINGGMQSAG